MGRVRFFIDFWNVVLGVKSVNSQYRINWEILPTVLLPEASSPNQGFYEGACVYASINPKSSKNLKLKDFLSNTLNRMPGYEVKIFERKAKKNPVCQSCHNNIEVCPQCSAPLERTVEKGVDTGIVTDMLQHAWDNTYDIGVLMSGDSGTCQRFLDTRF
jgi:uncharacterized LabA/DUF88 family protein